MKTLSEITFPQTIEEWQKFEDILNNSLQFKHVGVKIDLSDPQHPVVFLPEVRPEHLGGLGTEAVNGAVTAFLCDIAIGFTGTIQLKSCKRKGTAELNIRYLHPLVSKSIRVVGSVERAAKGLVFTSAKVIDDHERVCAIAQGIVACSSSN